MRIAFDGTTLTPGRTGVGYYTEHLLQHLAQQVKETGDELIVVSNQPIDTAQPLPRHVRVHADHRFPLRIVWMQMMAGRLLDEIRADVAHFTNGMLPLGTGAARVVTIHDMSLRLFPRCHPLRRLVINRPLLGVAARVADAHRHRVAQRPARSAPAARRRRRARDRRSRSRRPRLSSHRRSQPARADSRSLRAARAIRAVCRRYRAAQEPDAADGRRSPRRARRACRTSSSASDRTAGRRARSTSTSIGIGLRRLVHFTGYVPVEDLPAHLQPRRAVRVSVALRRLRVARRGGHGLRHAGDHGELVVAQRDRQRRRGDRRSAQHGGAHRGARASVERRRSARRSVEREAWRAPPSSRGHVPLARCWHLSARGGRHASCHCGGSVCRRRFRAGQFGVSGGVLMTTPMVSGARAAATVAFDRLAPDYDTLTGGEIFQRLRQRTHAVLARRFAGASSRARDRLWHRGRYRVSRVARRPRGCVRSIGGNGQPIAATARARGSGWPRQRPAVRPVRSRDLPRRAWRSHRASTASCPTSAHSTARKASRRSVRWRGDTSARRAPSCSA